MVNCCAVNCRNHSNKKELKGKVSFHDLPVAKELRAKWLRNIRRANWEPKETDKLCSSHFLPKDYRAGVKHRILLPDAIPTVFEGYPSYLTHRTQPRKPPAERQALPPRPVCADNKASADGGQHDGSISDGTPTVVESSSAVTSELPNKCDPTALRAQHRELRKDLKLALLQKQVKVQRQQISRMRLKMETYKQNITNLKQTMEREQTFRYADVVERILAAAEGRDLAAMLLKNQMDAFARKRVAWNKALLRQCMLWHNCSPRGYNYARKNCLLKLPNKSSIWRCLGAMREKALPQEMLLTQDPAASMALRQKRPGTEAQAMPTAIPQKLSAFPSSLSQAQSVSMTLSQELIIPQAGLRDQEVQVLTMMYTSTDEGLGNPENGVLGFVSSIEVG